MRFCRSILLGLALLLALPAVASDDVAADGFDPVLLVAGEKVAGDAAITAQQDGFVYRFVSEANRERFQREPERFSYQAQGSCAVMPEARARGDLYVVYQGKLYGFGSEGCKADFEESPEDFAAKDQDQGGDA